MVSETQSSGFRGWLSKHYEVLLLGAILLVALGLRLYRLEKSSLWLDELYQITLSRRSFFNMLKAVINDNASVPAESIITHFVYYYIGRSEGILRLPGVLWGALSVGAIYALGRRMFDRVTGMLAAALLAFMPSQIYFSQELRFYILASLMVLLATLTFQRALSLNTRGAWVLYAGTLTVGMYSHYYVAIVGLLHGAWLLLTCLAKRLTWGSMRRYVAAAGIAGLLFLPWVTCDTYVLLTRQGGFREEVFISPPLVTWLSTPFVGVNYEVPAYPLLTCLAVATGALAMAGVALAVLRKRKWWCNVGLAASVGLGGMALALALDKATSFHFYTRQMVPFGPLVVLLLCATWLGLFRAGWARATRRPANETVRGLAAVILVIFAAAALAKPLAGVYSTPKEDWRGATRYLLQHVRPDDRVLSYWLFCPTSYAPELADQIVPLKGASAIEEEAQTHARVWILERPSTLQTRFPDVQAWIESERLLEIRGFASLGLYLYSEKMTPQELKDSLKR